MSWKTEETVTKGSSQIEIQSRPGQRGGKIYSFFFGRVNDDRTSRYFRPSDFKDLQEALKEADNWIECDRHEDQQGQGNRRFA